jgi:hypothetical protein
VVLLAPRRFPHVISALVMRCNGADSANLWLERGA